MRHRSRRVGSAAVIVVALVLSIASSAWGAIPLTTSAYASRVVGDQVGRQIFTLAGGRRVECKTTHVTGVHPKKEAEVGELTLAPSFGECSTEVLGVMFPDTVIPHNCQYRLRLTKTPPGEAAGEGWEYTGVGELLCVEGKLELQVFASKLRDEQGISLCKYSIGPQGPLSSVDFKIENAGRALALRARLAGISVVKASGTLVNCGEVSQVGSYNGEIAAKATDEFGRSLTFGFN